MFVVKNVVTRRLVYREDPDFAPGFGILNATALDLGDPKDLIEIKVAAQEWDRELALREAERPVPVEVLIADLLERVTNLENRVL